MRRPRELIIFTLLAVALGVARAQSAEPLQLSPNTSAPEKGVKIPSHWKIIANGPEALTEEKSRTVMTLLKTMPVIDRKTVTTGLILRCSRTATGSALPQLVFIFTSLTGVEHFKNFSARYHFDEGPVHIDLSSEIGKNHARGIALSNPNAETSPMLAKLLHDLPPDPGVEIAGATRLRMEFNFRSAGIAFLDFDVSGSTQAMRAVGCQ
jgi:hypothetical protein